MESVSGESRAVSEEAGRYAPRTEGTPMTEPVQFAHPIGLSRDPHWDDAWTDAYTNEYVLPHPDNEFEKLRAGRASELGKTISNTFTLNQWHQRMVIQGVGIRGSLALEAAIAVNDGLTPKERRKRLQELATEAKNVAGGKEPAALGTGLHKITELVDARKIDHVPPPWDRDIVAYSAMLQKMGIVHVPEFTEKIIWVRSINVAGRFDRLVRYLRHCDKWHVEDFKTGRNLQYGWGEIPIQLWCYANADMIFDPDTRVWSDAPEICTEMGLVHHVPVGGPVDEDGNPLGYSESVLYEVDLTTRIEVLTFLARSGEVTLTPAELCVAVQQWRKTKRLAKPVARIRVTSQGEVIDAPLTWQERLDLASSEAELEEVRSEARMAGEWHGGLTRRFNERVEILAS